MKKLFVIALIFIAVLPYLTQVKQFKASVLHWLEENNGSRKALYAGYVMRYSYKAIRLPYRAAKKLVSMFRQKSTPNFFLPPVMTAQEKQRIHNSFRLLFCGDLILLEDQVKRARHGQDYIFDDMFEYTRKYIQSADLAIGVFEGPTAGQEAGYSTSNYGDGKALALNFPDSFAEAVKRAGFDLVTTANNHLLDKGREGAFRTLDVLDKIGLQHTGSYRNAQEKASNSIRLIEKDGLKFAILSYTYGCNSYSEEDLLNSEDLSFMTSMLVPPASKNFEKVKNSIRQDFERAKALHPDFIVVLPHMGSQFLKKPDYYQRTWVKLFKEFGADIILSDHTHSVQPAEITSEYGRKIFTAHCPGNYSNIYREFNGDANIFVEVYIDRQTHEITAGGIVPMWTSAFMNGNYRPIPMNDIADNADLASRFTTYDLERAEEVNRVITDTIFGHAFTFDMVRERYYFDDRGFVRERMPGLDADFDVQDSRFMKLVNSVKSVCFVGDSITQGSRNGGYPYYEPLLDYISAEVKSFAVGGGTVKTLLENADKITAYDSELYVIAIGTNDVRYCSPNICAMDEHEYIRRLQTLETLIKTKCPSAKFAYIASWWSNDGDPYCPLKFKEKTAKNNRYSLALKSHCEREGYAFFDVNEYISREVLGNTAGCYLVDHIHPNSKRGIYLYAKALLLHE